MNQRFVLTLIVSMVVPAFVQAQLTSVLQQGHELAVVAVAISPDSNFVCTASKDKSAKLWNVRNGREVRSFLGHEKTVSAIAFSPDGKTLITGSYDRSIRWWNVETGREDFRVNTVNLITDLAIDPSGRFVIATGYSNLSWGDSAQVYDGKTRRLIAKIPAAPDKGLGYGVSVAVSPDGTRVALGEDNRVATVYSTTDWKQTNRFEFEEGWCGGCATKVVFSPDSRFLFMASYKGPLRKYELSTSRMLSDFGETTEELTALSLSPDGKRLARVTETMVSVWNESTRQLLTEKKSEEGVAWRGASFDGAGNTLWLASENNTAERWDFRTNKAVQTLTGLLNQRDKGGLDYDPNFYWQSAIAKYVRFKNTILITPDGKTLLKGKFGSKVKQWDIASGKTRMDFTGHQKAVLAYALSKDGKKLVTGGGDGKIVLWDVETGDSLKVIRSYREPIFAIEFSPDETKVATSSWDATMKIHDLASGKLLTYFEFENSSVYDLQFHPNGLYLITARLDNSVQMWEPDTRTAVRQFIGHTDIVSTVRVHPEGTRLLSASWDGTIRQWDIGTGLMTQKLSGHEGAVHVAIYSPDGTQIVSGGADRLVRIWDAASGKSIANLRGHVAEITSIAFSPDRKFLMSHSVDGVTKFWDPTTYREFFEHIHFGSSDWMTRNPEGFFNATDGARQYIHFVDGLQTYSIDQFFTDYYRPDLMPRVFQNRGGDRETSSDNLPGKLKSSPPPGVKVAVVPSSDGIHADVLVRLSDTGGGVESLRLLHNGKSLPIDRNALTLPDGNRSNTTYQQRVTLIGGQNVFAATATNRSRIESEPATAEYFSDRVTQNSTCYILAVGINSYKNPRLTLNYARPDAESFLETLHKNGESLYNKIELHTVYDLEASKQGILKALDELATKIHPEDVFVFYYAGHGSLVDNSFYFIPTESSRLYDATSLKKEAIDAELLQERLKKIQALKQLIVMDACQSGASVEVLATRGASEEKAIAQLSRSTGIHVMASAGSDQFATEFAELGHGLFTYLLIKALGGDADGAPKDGKVTIYELKSYLDDQVPEMTRKLKGKPQYPYTFSRGQDFPVVLHEE